MNRVAVIAVAMVVKIISKLIRLKLEFLLKVKTLMISFMIISTN